MNNPATATPTSALSNTCRHTGSSNVFHHLP